MFNFVHKIWAHLNRVPLDPTEPINQTIPQKIDELPEMAKSDILDNEAK